MMVLSESQLLFWGNPAWAELSQGVVLGQQSPVRLGQDRVSLSPAEGVGCIGAIVLLPCPF